MGGFFLSEQPKTSSRVQRPGVKPGASMQIWHHLMQEDA